MTVSIDSGEKFGGKRLILVNVALKQHLILKFNFSSGRQNGQIFSE